MEMLEKRRLAGSEKGSPTDRCKLLEDADSKAKPAKLLIFSFVMVSAAA